MKGKFVPEFVVHYKPIYDNSFIYDNAANRIGKGIEHTLNIINMIGK